MVAPDLRRDQLQPEGMDPGLEGARLVDRLIEVGQREEPPPGWDPDVVLALQEATRLFRFGIELVDISLRMDDYRRSARLETMDTERFARLATWWLTNRRMVEGPLLMADFKEWVTGCCVHPPMGPPVDCTFDETYRQVVLDVLTE